MTIHQDEIATLIEKLEAYQASAECSLSEPEAIRKVAESISKAFSGSWLGYHSKVYYQHFNSPPPGHHFSREWGMKEFFGEGTLGDWGEYAFDDVVSLIHQEAGNPDLAAAAAFKRQGEKLFEECKRDAETLLRIFVSRSGDAFGEKLLEELASIKPFSRTLFLKMATPKGNFISRDNRAIGEGYMTPPHISVAADCFEYQIPTEAIERLLPVLKKAYSYISRSEKTVIKNSLVGTNVFIGHGRSSVWRDLKDFITERLRLPFDEFNRVPVAGITNIHRLGEMLDAAAIAFIVMTAEDEQADGSMEARTNVIHEVGLFQGRLGFTRAIILIEDGCQEFSNIQGLGQIKFPKGDIKAKFEEIRQVLEREGLIGM